MHNLKAFFVLTCVLCVLANPLLQAKCHKSSNSKPDNLSKADYVIVGVGTAGAVVAKKLSDDHKTSVIALHIGENLTEDPIIKFAEGALITVPAAIVGPPLYQNGETLPQPNADNQNILWAFALPEGGASSINAGAYCLGTKNLYANWEAIAGPHWSVKRILKLFKKLETYVGKTTDPKARGKNGPLNVRQVPIPSQVGVKFTQAMVAATGVSEVLDYNVVDNYVCSQLQYTLTGQDGQFRQSSVNAFLNEEVVSPDGRGVGNRKLTILFNSTGLKAIWKGNKAVGVKYLHNGKTKKVFAKKGVVICCGLKSSPFLLHSGIGPRNLLESLGIPVIYDNPNVGQGLADQPPVRVLFTSNPLDTPLDFQGLFANISSFPVPGGDPNQRAVRFATINAVPGFTLCTIDLLQPKSRGSVSINSPDPLSDPVIDLGVLSNPQDLDLFRAALQIYLKNINQQIQQLDPFYKLIFPDPAILDDANHVEDFIRANVASNLHYQSHCRMAALEAGGVVDGTGHVYGVKNLIVADDSIVPLCMDGSPMSFAYLIGENIAELLIKQHKK